MTPSRLTPRILVLPYHGTSAALEFAVQSLKVRHIVVLGHGRCDGIRAALHPAAQPLSPGDFIGKWMKLLGPAAGAVAAGTPVTDAERQTALERARYAARSRTCAPFPASRSRRAATGSGCTAPGSTSPTATSGRWTRPRENSPERGEAQARRRVPAPTRPSSRELFRSCGAVGITPGAYRDLPSSLWLCVEGACPRNITHASRGQGRSIHDV